MNEKEYNKIKKKVEIALNKYGARNFDHEEITQDVMLMWAERGFKKGQTVDQAVIDCLRKYTGRKGSCGYIARKELQNAASLDDGYQLGRNIEPYVGERGDYRGFERFFCGDERAIYLLIVKWGFSEVEVADLFGVSESRICQRYKGIQSRISARVKKEARGSEKRSREMEEILSEEAKRNIWGVESFSDQSLAVGESW